MKKKLVYMGNQGDMESIGLAMCVTKKENVDACEIVITTSGCTVC